MKYIWTIILYKVKKTLQYLLLLLVTVPLYAQTIPPYYTDVNLNKTGNDIFDILKEEFDIQVEVGESRIVLAIISVGDTLDSINHLLNALRVISERYYSEDPAPIPRRKYFQPDAIKSPRDAFFSETEYIPIREAEGRIAGDQIMIYPPGIPLLVPGERISKGIITEYIRLIKQGNKVIGSINNGNIKIKVLK